MKERLFKYFNDNNIASREELRKILAEDKLILSAYGINQTIMEGYYAEYMKTKKNKTRHDVIKVATINDIHVPFHNEKALNNFIELLRDEQPNKIILNGDMLDFYDLSSFDKDPNRVNKLQEEIDIFHSVLSLMRKACPNAQIIPILGNHEDRLRRFLWKNPELASLRDLDINRLLRLEEIGVDNFVESYEINGFEFTHGKIVRKHSSYSAKCEYEDRNHSGMSGHTHRLGSFYKTVAGATYAWFENGCMCDTAPVYISGVANWQNGFSIIYFEDNAYDVHQVYINNGKFRYNGKVYK